MHTNTIDVVLCRCSGDRNARNAMLIHTFPPKSPTVIPRGALEARLKFASRQDCQILKSVKFLYFMGSLCVTRGFPRIPSRLFCRQRLVPAGSWGRNTFTPAHGTRHVTTAVEDEQRFAPAAVGRGGDSERPLPPGHAQRGSHPAAHSAGSPNVRAARPSGRTPIGPPNVRVAFRPAARPRAAAYLAPLVFLIRLCGSRLIESLVNYLAHRFPTSHLGQ